MRQGITLLEIVDFLDGELVVQSPSDISNELEVSIVNTDSRQLQKGALFVALKGDNFDGHDFVVNACQKGCVAAVVDHVIESSIPQIVVKDTLIGLGGIAGINRQGFTGTLVGVTGSSGKTSVKEMLKAALEEFGSVLATKGNFNNAIGVPLTLFGISDSHKFAVIEMGANHVGEIAYSSSIAKPDVALITNAAEAHLEGFGSYDSVVKAKGEILDNVSNEGVVILNKDDSACDGWCKRAGNKKIILFSAKGQRSADVYADNVDIQANSVTFDLVTSDASKGDAISSEKVYPMHLNMPGLHNIANAIAAISVVVALDLDVQKAINGIERMTSVPGRLRSIALNDQITVLDDTYNANPSSMSAAFEVLSHFAGLKIAVIGDMAELGEQAEKLHERTAVDAKNKGIDALYCCGKYNRSYLKGFGKNAYGFDDQAGLIMALNARLSTAMSSEHKEINTALLVKGSRRAQMDKVVDALEQFCELNKLNEEQIALPEQE